MIRRPPRSTRTDTLFPTRRSSDLWKSVTTMRLVAPARSRGFTNSELSAGATSHDTVSPIATNLMTRSEEHTSELQSLMRISYAVFCLKKKITNHTYSPEHKESNKLTTQPHSTCQ